VQTQAEESKLVEWVPLVDMDGAQPPKVGNVVYVYYE
jgi:hypothetical protein